MLDEPEQGWPDTAEFGHLVEDEDDGFLDTAIGILLEPVADLHEADRGSDDEFATPGLLIAGRQGTVAQKIELILVEAALQSQQQPVVALTRRYAARIVAVGLVDLRLQHRPHVPRLDTDHWQACFGKRAEKPL